MLESEVPIT